MCIRDSSRGVRSAQFLVHIPNLPTNAGLEGVRGREIANSQAPIRNPPIRDPCTLLLVEREGPE
eukprot:8591789-Alexandrium_andersonii.AAC.1